jgi:tetratricopeptide (TPR) repeat protein
MKVKAVGIFFICAIIVLTSAAQLPAHIDRNSITSKVTFGCNFFGSTQNYIPTPAKNISADQEFMWMRDMIDKIVGLVGLQNRFEIKSMKNYNNCSALCISNETGESRYLQFDRDFLEAYEKQTGNKWFVIGVVAHEIAHHLNGHSLDGVGSRPNKELEADEFAGFVLFKLGATLAEAQGIFSFLNDTEGPPTHPVKAKRYAAVKTGWLKAQGNYTYDAGNDEVGDFALVEGLLKAIRGKKDKTLARNTVNLCNIILNITPDNNEAVSTKGVNYAVINMPDSAIYFCNKAVATEPYVAMFRLNLCRALMSANRLNEALEFCDDAIYLKPALPLAYQTKAEVLLQQKKYEAAIDNCNWALQLNPEKNTVVADILTTKGIALYELGKKADAVQLFNDSKKADADNILLKNYLLSKKITL